MIFEFMSWHYSQGIQNFFKIWKNFLDFFWEYFSVRSLFRTLFSPWKRDVSRQMRRGFHPILALQSAFETLVTIVLGAMVKTAVILFAIFLEIAAVFLGMALFLVWLALPLALVISLLGFSFASFQGVSGSSFFYFVTFFVSTIFFIISFKSFRKEEFDYFSMSLLELNSQKWFIRVWERVGAQKNSIDSNMLRNQELLEEYLKNIEISLDELNEVIEWEILNQIEREKKGKFWLRENLALHTPIGRHWAFAYTVNLDKYAIDLSDGDYSEYRNARLIGKEKDMQELELLLVRPSQNNIILIGETGVGKDTLVHTLARTIRNREAGEVLNSKRILELPLREIMSNFKTKNEIDNVLGHLFGEATYAGNIVLFIKNIDQYLKNNPQGPGEDISEILSQFLSFPDFQIIGTTTPSKFHSEIEKKENVMKYCDKIIIDEMNESDTKKVLLHKLKTIERGQVLFTLQALREIVKLAGRYVTDSPNPEKSLDLMEEVLLYWSGNGYSEAITPQIVDEAVSSKIKVPLGEMSQDESEKLLELENILHNRVIGQDFAIKQIAETMRRARVGMANDKKPLGSFLFLGPTGVGKTESAKALAEAYFGDENRMIRIDMSEYQARESIDRLIGSSSSNVEGYLVSKVKESPYAILLLDEIEKAYPDILNLFLQVLDEGYLTDAFGKKISFKNLIIIATSNAGAEIIKESIQLGLDQKETQGKVIDFAIKEGIFRPEFLNRFEGVIFFHPLEAQEILEVTRLLLERYAAKLKDQENMSVEFDLEIVKYISEKAFDPLFGARAIDRFIQDRVGDKIIKKIISGEIKKGDSFVFGSADLNDE